RISGSRFRTGCRDVARAPGRPAGGPKNGTPAFRCRDPGVGVSRIRVNIDKVVLKGVDPIDRKALVEGLQSELSRVLADPATRAEWPRSYRTPVLRLGRMTLDPGPSGSQKFGVGVARAIRRGVKP